MTKILVKNVKNRENIIWAKKKKDKKTIIYHSKSSRKRQCLNGQKMTTFLVMAFSSFINSFVTTMLSRRNTSNKVLSRF